MQFLHPFFLFALAAIAIPIIIHLFNFRTYKTVYFSNIQFLRNVKQQSRAQSELMHRLVLLARILVLACLVLAFAQPYIPVADVKQKAAEREVVSLYIDNSFSMDAESKYGRLLDVAKSKARDIVLSYRPSTRFLLITNDFEPRHQHLLNREQFFDMLDEVQTSPQTRNLSEIQTRMTDFMQIGRQTEQYLQADQLQQYAYILSDFQRTTSDFNRVKYDSSFAVTLLPLSTQTTNNLYIDSCWFETPARKLNQPEELMVKIINRADQAYQDVPVRLFINDSLKTLSSFNIAERSELIIKLAYTNTQIGIIGGRVEITDYPITYDNTFFFSYNILQSLNALVIVEKEDNQYLKALFDKDDYIKLKQQKVSDVRVSELALYQTIVVSEVRNLSSGLIQELVNFVSAGGTLALVPEINAESKVYNQLLTMMNMNTFEAGVDKQKSLVEKINYRTELYRNVFKETNDNTDVPIVFQHFVSENMTKVSKEVILATQNDHEILTLASFGKGKVYTFAISLNDKSSNFARHPLFVPTFYNIVLYSQTSSDIYHIIGRDQNLSLDLPRNAIGNQPVAKGDNDVFHIVSPDRTFDFIPRHFTDANGGNMKLQVQQNIRQANNYLVTYSDTTLLGAAFNYNRTESDMQCYTPTDIKEQLQTNNLSNISLIENAHNDTFAGNLREANQGYPLWKYFIIGALLFLAAEILLIRLHRYWKRKTTQEIVQ